MDVLRPAFAIFEDLQKVWAGICPGCGNAMPPLAARPHDFTCSAACQRTWVERFVARYGETMEITHHEPAGYVVYLVPTRVALNNEIQGGAGLRRYPKKDTPAITCPRCRRTSYNLNDVVQRYCGACHRFLDDEGA